jgi:DNA polymerase-3 subunit delta'
VTGIFDGLPAQPEAQRLLGAALSAPGHAYLLSGPAGTGKRRYSERFAAALLDSRLGRIESRAHPDLFVLEAEGGSILIDAARELRRDLYMRPFEAERRAYLVLDAHLLRTESANALLKSLEEPPAYAVFVLVSDHAEAMLPTIRSRVTPIPFRRLSSADLAAHTGDAEAARAALGNSALAERLATDPASAERRGQYLELARASLVDAAFDPASAARVITEAASARADQAQRDVRDQGSRQLDGIDDPRQRKALEKRIDERAKRTARRAQIEEVRDALDVVAQWYRDLMVAGLGAEDLVINLRTAGDLVADARRSSPADAARAVAIASEARRSLESNVQPALAVEAMFHRLRLVPAGS